MMPDRLAGPPNGTGRLRAIRDYPEAKIPLVWVENPPLSQRVQSEKMSMRILRALAAIGAVLLFAGCQSMDVDTETSFDENHDKAIVVIGIGKEMTSDYAPYQEFVWRAYNPETGQRTTFDQAFIMDWPGCEVKNSKNCKSSGFRYYSKVIEPGHYFFHYVRAMIPGHSITTSYMTNSGKRFDPKDGERPNVLESKTPRFQARAGEAVYIGDFIFQGALRIASLKDLRFDLLAARAYMSRYPGIQVPLQPRPAALPLLTN